MKWKFARTRIWMYYVSEVSPLPPPFNLIPVDKAASCIQWLAKRCWCINKVRVRIGSWYRAIFVYICCLSLPNIQVKIIESAPCYYLTVVT